MGAFERMNHFLSVPDMETAIPQSPTPWYSLCTDSSAVWSKQFRVWLCIDACLRGWATNSRLIANGDLGRMCKE